MVGFRIDSGIYKQLKGIASELGWTLSEVLRYLVYVSYSTLRPDVKISAVELTQFLVKECDPSGEIEAWKVIKFLVPRAIEKIERIEKELKKSRK